MRVLEMGDVGLLLLALVILVLITGGPKTPQRLDLEEALARARKRDKLTRKRGA
jgi:hypothetical protein